MDARPTLVLSLSVGREPNLCCHGNAVVIGSGLDERPVEEVSVVRDHDVGLPFLHVLKETTQQRHLEGWGSHDPGDDVIDDVMITSSGSLMTMNGPSYSGFGVYSKSSTSAPTTSRLVIRYPWRLNHHGNGCRGEGYTHRGLT